MSKINARSPYYVSTGTVTNLTSCTLDLYIYDGLRGLDRPSSPTYTIESTAVLNKSVFEISELVRDYFTNYFSGEYASVNLWVDYQLTEFISGVAQTPQTLVELTAFYGYGYFEDGANPQNADTVLQSNRSILKLADTPAVLPLYINQDIDVSYLLNGQVVYSTDFSFDDENTEQIKYVTNGVNGADMFEDRVIQDGGAFESNVCLTAFEDEFALLAVDEIRVSDADGNLTIVTVQDIEECKYQPYKLTFVNKYGALQSIWFFKRTNEVLTTKSEKYKSNIIQNNTYSTSRHQQKILTKNGSEKLTLNTGFYPEEYNDVFKQMQLSEDCWIEINSQTLPINVSSSSLNYKTHLNDKLINYTIEVDFAFDTINNIR
jgi:hypothetical protein